MQKSSAFGEGQPNSDGDDDSEIAWDDMKNQPLDPREVRKARTTEMKYVKDQSVYEYAKISECREKTGAAPIETK